MKYGDTVVINIPLNCRGSKHNTLHGKLCVITNDPTKKSKNGTIFYRVKFIPSGVYGWVQESNLDVTTTESHPEIFI